MFFSLFICVVFVKIFIVCVCCVCVLPRDIFHSTELFTCLNIPFFLRYLLKHFFFFTLFVRIILFFFFFCRGHIYPRNFIYCTLCCILNVDLYDRYISGVDIPWSPIVFNPRKGRRGVHPLLYLRITDHLSSGNTLPETDQARPCVMLVNRLENWCIIGMIRVAKKPRPSPPRINTQRSGLFYFRDVTTWWLRPRQAVQGRGEIRPAPGVYTGDSLARQFINSHSLPGGFIFLIATLYERRFYFPYCHAFGRDYIFSSKIHRKTDNLSSQ